jgi:hypothetical protein
MFRSVLVSCLVGSPLAGVLSVGPLEAQARIERLPPFPMGSTIEAIASEFRSGGPASVDQLTGEWKATRHVITERYVTGRSGPDRIAYDSSRLAFRRAPKGSAEVWYAGVPRWIAARFSDQREVSFELDDASDITVFMTCRLVTTDHLVCFDLDHLTNGAGYAIEFVKQARNRRRSNEELKLTAPQSAAAGSLRSPAAFFTVRRSLTPAR